MAVDFEPKSSRCKRSTNEAGTLVIKRIFTCAVLLAGSTGGAFANGSEARIFSTLGQPPRVFTEAPPDGTMLRAFEVIYIDDHKCPGGRLKKYTAGNDRLGVRPTLVCVDRQTRLGQ